MKSICGICGIYGIEDKILIEKMLLSIKHRGPDGRGIYTNTNFSMGHARLSIIDLSENGRQPMSNEMGDIWLAVNGEIYNFLELKASLEKAGHIFHSHSDSEVIIHAYEQYGFEFIKKLRGMFALALYDQKKCKLILGRDPIGKKPLYYYFNGNILFFASEIKAILAAGIKPKINMRALSSFLAYEYSLGEQTMFEGIKKVLPGNILILQDRQLIIQQYWDIQENLIQSDELFVQTTLRSRLDDATKLFLNSDVPIGAFLSGGIDSSSVVALAKPYINNDFHTFSVGFPHFSELEYGKIVSEHLDTIHHEIIVTDKMALHNISKIGWHNDEPLGDAAIISIFLLSNEAKKFVTVILAGEGGDEVFGGYPNYSTNLKLWGMLKNPILKPIFTSLIKHIPNSNELIKKNYIARYLRYCSYFNELSITRCHQNTTRIRTDNQIQEEFFLPNFNINDMANYPVQMRSELNSMLAMDCKNLLPEKFLMKTDKATMAHSIEARLPLLDIKLVEYAFSISPILKIKQNTTKYILKKSMGKDLPPLIIQRKKQGFGTPFGAWMQNELFEIMEQKINDGELLQRILKPEKREHLINNLRKQIELNQNTVWSLFTLELWHDIFFKKSVF